MDFSSAFNMLLPVLINIGGGVVASIVAGKFAENIHGWQKQGLIILLCLGASFGNLYLSGNLTGISLDFSTTEGTFTSVGVLLTLMATAWTSSQAFYYKAIKKEGK
jgi:hypothetical protein